MKIPAPPLPNLKPGDRVQLTRYWLIHHGTKGAPRVPRTAEDVGVFDHIMVSGYQRKEPIAYVRWISGSPQRDGYITLRALEPFGTPR
jgi:hypothetical protein